MTLLSQNNPNSSLPKLITAIRTILIQVFIILLLLIVIEGVCFLINKNAKQTLPFLIDRNLIDLKNHQQLKGYGFYLVDPLLGWGYSAASVRKLNVETENNCFVLRTKIQRSHPIKIFITGGSTSDIGLNKENWPVQLLKILNDSSISATIYVAAIGGFSTGQELLKIIRDGVPLHPDILISYSGANEFISPCYVSQQENNFYRKAFSGKSTPAFMPNAVTAIRNLFPHETDGMELYNEKRNNAAQYWINNMKAMSGIATANNYSFYGFLQPVLGIGKITQPKVENEYHVNVERYASFYPELIQYTDSAQYLTNLTSIFDNSPNNVFGDDCHITDQYQYLVAHSIFVKIAESGKLKQQY